MVAIDPRTGAVLAMTSTPTFDATPISGDPTARRTGDGPIENQPGNPLVARDRQGHYTPGLDHEGRHRLGGARDRRDHAARRPSPTSRARRREGFVVDGFRVLEHDLSPVEPALWALSEALQVSSNIFFAHVGLEVGAERFLDYARRFGFCAPGGIGRSDRALPVAASFVSAPEDGDCGPFADDVELASASFGQGQTAVTPVQMALVAAAIASDGVMPHPYVVRDVRMHATGDAPSDEILETFGSGGGTRVVAPRRPRRPAPRWSTR